MKNLIDKIKRMDMELIRNILNTIEDDDYDMLIYLVNNYFSFYKWNGVNKCDKCGKWQLSDDGKWVDDNWFCYDCLN